MFTVSMTTEHTNPNPAEITFKQVIAVRKSAEGLEGEERDYKMIQEAFVLGQKSATTKKVETPTQGDVDFGHIWDELNEVLKGFTIPAK